MSTARVVSWSERLELTVETPGGETVTLDVPSLLHDAGLLSKITRADGSVPLRINHASGKYVGVNTVDTLGYSALSGRTLVASSSAREVAYGRATTLGRKRRLEKEEKGRPPTQPQRQQSTTHEPTSPVYSPTSPVYEQTEKAADGDECEFVKERTREERDEEGRANAIALEE